MDFYQQNKLDWIAIQKRIFPHGIPKSSEWTDLEDIVKVINVIGSIDNSNHMFYPRSGGLDIKSAKLSHEYGCIEIDATLIDILKPKRLLFESFDDLNWSYFRLETYELEPSGVYDNEGAISEEVTELPDGRLIDRVYWDEDEYNGEDLPFGTRVVTRYLNGSFVIFSKSSPYNLNSSTYDARHNKLTSEEFRTYIENVIVNGWQE